MLKYLLAILFISSAYAGNLICVADNGKQYSYTLPEGSHGEFTETINWKSGTGQKIVVKDINHLSPSDDYLKLMDGKYSIVYSLSCLYE